jgi:hypothetical protein
VQKREEFLLEDEKQKKVFLPPLAKLFLLEVGIKNICRWKNSGLMCWQKIEFFATFLQSGIPLLSPSLGENGGIKKKTNKEYFGTCKVAVFFIIKKLNTVQ